MLVTGLPSAHPEGQSAVDPDGDLVLPRDPGQLDGGEGARQRLAVARR
jgi:hypothetical protein